LLRDWRSRPKQPGLNRPERDDHSSRSRIAPGLEQPTRGWQRRALASATHTGRAGPPLLFGLAPRGVFRAPDVATRAVGSYPTFSPLPNELDRKRRAVGIASGLPPRCKRHRRYIFCGTFRSRARADRFRETHGTTPWRYQARCPFVARSCETATMESGLSSRSLLSREAGRRSPGSSAISIIRCECGQAPQSKVRCIGTGKTSAGVWEMASGRIQFMRTRLPRAGEIHFKPINFSNSPSSRMGTPSDLALSYFEPGSAPTTT